MKFETPLTRGTLIKRYKRFLADVRLENGTVITAHCPNSGSMRSCDFPGSPVLLSKSANAGRKYPYMWEMIYTNNVWAGIHTGRANGIVFEGIKNKKVKPLARYNEIKREVWVSVHSRLDALLSNGDEKCYVEIKNVTLQENNVAYFPDAVTTRGTKHLRELMTLKKKGHRACIFFLVQRSDCGVFMPADHIDFIYGQTLRKAVRAGVEIFVHLAKVSPRGISLWKPLPYALDRG